MDRDGRWNRGGGHARVSGDCSHWLENQSETGRNVTGIRWAGRERGEGSWPMSINGSPSPPLSPVHNNFDSRVIIAFLKQVSLKKNILSWDDDFQPVLSPNWRIFCFFFLSVASLTLVFSFLFFRFRLIVKFFFFFSLLLLATISPLYLFFLRFQRLITFFFVPRHDLFHFQSSFSTTISFLSLFPDRSSLYTRAKSGQRILPLLNRIYLPSIPSTIPFISLFPHVRENEK